MATVTEPRTRRFSREEFYRLMNLGWFLGQSVELIRGEIIEMPNQKSGHYAAIDKASKLLEKVFGPSSWIRTQAPLALPGDTEPNPDISIVRGSRADYLEQHPSTALLVVEVSDSTLRYDRQTKAQIYAAAQIADYWIINLPERKIEVYRQPAVNKPGEFEFSYEDVRVYKSGEMFAPLAAPQAAILVDDLLP